MNNPILLLFFASLLLYPINVVAQKEMLYLNSESLSFNGHKKAPVMQYIDPDDQSSSCGYYYPSSHSLFICSTGETRIITDTANLQPGGGCCGNKDLVYQISEDDTLLLNGVYMKYNNEAKQIVIFDPKLGEIKVHDAANKCSQISAEYTKGEKISLFVTGIPK
ncbi:MAG TPA: hypothetical protein VE978_22745 [Chitinophagales bacterium]|nr:hypothetical protein [Chitinophagales bacterium]